MDLKSKYWLHQLSAYREPAFCPVFSASGDKNNFQILGKAGSFCTTNTLKWFPQKAHMLSCSKPGYGLHVTRSPVQ